jgi:hypothetical protein
MRATPRCRKQIRRLRLALVGLVASSVVVAASNAPADRAAAAVGAPQTASAAAPPAPTDLILGASSFTSSMATWQWKTVPGGVTYVLTVKAIGSGKVKKWETGMFPMPTLSIAKSALPKGASGGYRATVQARALNGKLSKPSKVPQIKAAAVKKNLKSTSVIKDEDDKNGAKKALKEIGKCANAGGSAAIGFFAVGAPFVAFSTPIPGVGELTWTGLTAVAAIAGGGQTVACFAQKFLPFGRRSLYQLAARAS